MKKQIITVFMTALIIFATVNAQAEEDTISGLLGIPTPTPITEPSPEPTTTPEPIPAPIIAIQEAIPTPSSIIAKAVQPRTFSIALEIVSMTSEEKLETLEINMESILISLTFIQKVKGFDISQMQSIIAQIRGTVMDMPEKKIDILLSVTSSIDGEIVSTIFDGTITQQDIDRMTAQLNDAVLKNLDDLSDSDIASANVTLYLLVLCIMLGAVAGLLVAVIWSISFKP